MKLPVWTAPLSLAIRPKTAGDAQRLAEGLDRLVSQSAGLQVRGDRPGEVVVIGAESEEQLESVVDRLRLDFHVEASLERPQVEFREALRRPAECDKKYAKYADHAGVGQYAHVKVRLAPRELGSGYRFVDETTGGAVPRQFVDAVNDGIQQALAAGVLAGYPIHDVDAMLFDGSYHEIDSSEAAFRAAASLAAAEAARQADPVVLEPMMRVEAVVPADQCGDVLQDLAARRGRIESVQARGAMTTIEARAPLAELPGYAIHLRSRTRGLGSCLIHFDAYVPLRRGDDDEANVAARIPRKHGSDPRDSGVALPLPEDAHDQ